MGLDSKWESSAVSDEMQEALVLLVNVALFWDFMTAAYLFWVYWPAGIVALVGSIGLLIYKVTDNG